MHICTVAIPVYNRRDLVQRALQSVLTQDIDDLDILVVDNCSDDGTWEALTAYRDPRLRLVRNERNVGLFGNLIAVWNWHTGVICAFFVRTIDLCQAASSASWP